MPKSKYMDAKEKKASAVRSSRKTAKKTKFIEAREAVVTYMKKHSDRQVWTSELAEKLNLDLGTLIDVLNDLYDKGDIEKGKE